MKNPSFPGALSPSLRDRSRVTSFEATMAAHTVAIHNRLRREATENAAINTEGRGSAIVTVAEIMVAATNALRGPGWVLRGSRSRAAWRRAKGNKIHVPIVAAKKINSLSGDPSLSLNRTEKTAKSPITATAAMMSFCHSGRWSISSDFRNNFITRTSLSRPAAPAVSPAGRILRPQPRASKTIMAMCTRLVPPIFFRICCICDFTVAMDTTSWSAMS